LDYLLAYSIVATNWRSTVYVKSLGDFLLQVVRIKQVTTQKKDNFIHFSLDFTPFSVILVYMIKIEKIEKLQKDIAFWQDKLNRSRKESLRSIRAVHLQHAQSELKKLQESA